MRISPGWMTFLVGLVLLAMAGVLYQQSLVTSGKVGAQAATLPLSRRCRRVHVHLPMHPQVRQDHPGTCPICGMDLYPRSHPHHASTATAAPSAHPGSI